MRKIQARHMRPRCSLGVTCHVCKTRYFYALMSSGLNGCPWMRVAGVVSCNHESADVIMAPILQFFVGRVLAVVRLS